MGCCQSRHDTEEETRPLIEPETSTCSKVTTSERALSTIINNASNKMININNTKTLDEILPEDMDQKRSKYKQLIQTIKPATFCYYQIPYPSLNTYTILLESTPYNNSWFNQAIKDIHTSLLQAKIFFKHDPIIVHMTPRRRRSSHE